jgi:hypothetical protein
MGLDMNIYHPGQKAQAIIAQQKREANPPFKDH